MRTVTFKQLYDRIIRRTGLDPLTDIGQAEARWIVDALNQRVAHIWPLTPFPSLMRTQERGFRDLWDSTRQYHFLNFTDNLLPKVVADEVMWVTVDGTAFEYYVAVKDPARPHTPPTIGISPPLNPAQWDVLTPVTPMVDYEPSNLPSIGIAYGVYNTNPSNNNLSELDGTVCHTFDALRFQPSENGLRVISSHGQTVWVWFQIPAPQYTIVPYIDNKAYAVGARIYYPTDGRVYRCVLAQGAVPINLANWREEIVPEFLQGYLLAGTCADYLKQGNPADPAVQAKLASSTVCEAEATEKYQGLVDRLSIEGYKPKLQWPSMGVQQWLGDSADPLYIIFFLPPGSEPDTPITPTDPGVVWEYHPEVQFLKTSDGVPSLSGITTALKQVTSMIEVVIGGTHMKFQLVEGAATPGDPGQVAPDDYASVSNDKHWNRLT